MRVLYFSRDYTSHDYRFLSALAKTEHQVSYLRLERRGHILEERALPPEIEQIPWVGGGNPAGLRQGPRLLADLRRVIQTVKPDLIQAGPIQRSALLVALLGFQPLLSMSWGYDLIFDANRSWLWRWATRFTLQRSAVLLGDSSVVRQLAMVHGMPGQRIITFPWGIDLTHFHPANRFTVPRSNASKFTILSTRSWEPIYGVDVIALAFVTAAKARPDMRLVMLGNGSLATPLRQIFLRGGVEEQVICPGHVAYAELPHYYRMADLYVSASHSDGASISLLEAMACGLPALVSDIPGNCEWVTPGDNGWLFPDHDTNTLAAAFIKAYDDRAHLTEIGHNARRVTEERSDWAKNFPKLLDAYSMALRQA